MPPKYRDADWLEARYHGDGWTRREMADACGVSPTTVREWMKRYDIETRDMESENHPLYGESRDESVRTDIRDDGRAGICRGDETEDRQGKQGAGNRGGHETENIGITDRAHEVRPTPRERIDGRLRQPELARRVQLAVRGRVGDGTRAGARA